MGETTWGTAGSVPGSDQAAGDAGAKYLNEMLHKPMDADAAQRLATGGSELKKMAENGSFAINEAGLQTYLKACDLFLKDFGRWRSRLEDLTRAARMGDSKYAKEVAAFNAIVAGSDGNPQSLLPNLDLMHDGIKQAKEALLIARKNYRETEEAHSISFAKINKELEHQ
ncbi:hypothetical protein [Amycolatopsis samaneae]|uniref:Uncharacterized protein n=1 Tax=Amycolatopsis samaneae TaxID=664691 RepID=A0ABW5GIV9_9PSEU